MNRQEADECLAKVRKTIDESNALIDQAKLRIAETDRFLAQQGLTREQVMKMSFTDEQKAAVNAKLRELGLPAVEEDGGEAPGAGSGALGDRALPEEKAVTAGERSGKFGAMMHGIRL